MRAVRICASGARKSRTALLQKRTASRVISGLVVIWPSHLVNKYMLFFTHKLCKLDPFAPRELTVLIYLIYIYFYCLQPQNENDAIPFWFNFELRYRQEISYSILHLQALQTGSTCTTRIYEFTILIYLTYIYIFYCLQPENENDTIQNADTLFRLHFGFCCSCCTRVLQMRIPSSFESNKDST